MANVMAVTAVSAPHGVAAAAGYAPALIGTLLVHTSPRYRRTARILCVLALIPNTLGSIGALDRSSRSRTLSLYVGVGGVLLGFGYLVALRGPD
jgi:hypothetical protein